MELAQFERVVRDTIDSLPESIREDLKDVIIVIEDAPPPRAEGGVLLGLYEGVPLTAWGRDFNGKMPDKITLFRSSIEQLSRTEEELTNLIRETLRHEIAHHFGFDHPQIRMMEERWRTRKT